MLASAADEGDVGLNLGFGRSPRRENGNNINIVVKNGDLLIPSHLLHQLACFQVVEELSLILTYSWLSILLSGLGCTGIIPYFDTQIVPYVVSISPVYLASIYVLLSHPCHGFSTSVLAVTVRCDSLPALMQTISPGDFDSFQERMVLRHQHPGARHAHP